MVDISSENPNRLHMVVVVVLIQRASRKSYKATVWALQSTPNIHAAEAGLKEK